MFSRLFTLDLMQLFSAKNAFKHNLYPNLKFKMENYVILIKRKEFIVSFNYDNSINSNEKKAGKLPELNLRSFLFNGEV